MIKWWYRFAWSGFRERWGGPCIIIHSRHWYRKHFKGAHL
jgi:hypothetical protein